jgi:hypothetical protein
MNKSITTEISNEPDHQIAVGSPITAIIGLAKRRVRLPNRRSLLTGSRNGVATGTLSMGSAWRFLDSDGFRGPNGSGKTTTIGMIFGLIQGHFEHRACRRPAVRPAPTPRQHSPLQGETLAPIVTHLDLRSRQ